ncbi:unnamed protein product [Ceutorhynchus assimilis]|uniref:KN motif and ankyrin repeat domain-containing protein 1 n=1 Tax=Ceutorhynchus assimilis TaxID=467358 RepID=A0A9N9M970_9CUCU|nr:unnamed protein product [Ceutorhynchus assimilis]
MAKYPANLPPFEISENGYSSWYDDCPCCPYGYHIDLDFVRYCESIGNEAKNRKSSIKRRKDNRRKQRQSMEMLLGLTPPVLAVLDEAYKKTSYSQEPPKIIQNQAAKATQDFLFNGGFDDALSDFEEALQKSNKTHSPNYSQDVTDISENLRRVPSVSPVSSPSGFVKVLPNNRNGPLKPDFDAVGIECCPNPMALQNIRESLALSLERTKVLEQQVKLIPSLQDELARIRSENQHLNQKLNAKDTAKLNTINGNYIQAVQQPNRTRSQSFSYIDSFDDDLKKVPPPPPPRKDFGVMCGVLTRNIGVGHQNPNTKHASTITNEVADKWWLPDRSKVFGLQKPNTKHASTITSDRWLPDKTKFFKAPPLISPKPKITVTKGTQTLLVKEKRDMGIQTSILEPKKVPAYTQTDKILKPLVVHTGSLAVAKTTEMGVQKNVECYSVGSSDDTIDNVICENCNASKRSVGVGPENTEDIHTSPVSLAALSNGSDSFNLGEDRLDLQKKTRTIASQYENNSVSKSLQVEVKTSSKSTQHEIKLTEKNTQYENNSVSKNTDTKDLQTPTKSIGCEAKEERPKTAEKGSSTIIEEKEVSEEKICAKCDSKEMETSRELKKDGPGSPNPSRIPVPTTPIEARKFRRQDTYTKIYSTSPTDKSPLETYKLSGLDLSPKAISTESISPFDKVKQNLRLDASASASNSKSQNGVNLAPITKVQIQETILPVSESTIFQTPAQNRKKATPSKEMQGAMKVLNDSLHKSPTKALQNHSAINIVTQEWFKISSLLTANPLDVEDYLDALEDVSSLLLQYVVNMTDASGNTAMHYAVSHGNFDVVSILLDSKVCDINKPNKAGYTSVMLVSLAAVMSQTHANVVRRLFQLADVNIRASQHGQTALMLAVSHGRLDMVKMLLEAGADINIQDEDGSTALMCAAEHGHIEIVKHFLSQPDCDSSITDVDGSTPLKIAMEAGHRQIGVLLYAHERNFQKAHPNKLKKTKSNSPKTPSSPLPIRSSHRALTDTKK